MMKQPSRKTSLLISQVSILLISLVTAFIPQYYIYIFILYFIIIMAFMFRSTRKMSKIPPKKELGSPLFKENNAIKIAMLDKLLTAELKKQFTASMSLLLLTFLVFIIFPLYRQFVFVPVHELLSSIIGNPVLVNFLDFFIMYEFVFGILSILRFFIMGKMSGVNIMLPQNFILYKKGIIANDRFFIELTSDLCYKYDLKRHFVELRSRTNKNFRVRLYTDSTSDLLNKIKDLGVVQCAEEEV
ncbi:membrane protein-like protein [Staphylothermus marinus F1]|uniref:Membrane protein-like protein n=1 Tax=Staphylothermus marinus (strain ATCC 43588 / DSM 3639 / JCM 9404 / F1) TaxID=399550 RepID=A3DN60_STAMF|nr:DUF2208 domain-containing protein [Staphylothermus marinus]ABN70070.1 membrane protein-like protein [Staphylothermus marinus F1]